MTFSQYFHSARGSTAVEENTVASVGIGGATPTGGAVGNQDSYATGDARMPTSIFGSRVQKRQLSSKRRRRK